MRNARFWDNNQGGVDISACQTAIVENCTLVGNKPFAFRYSVGSANGILQNNIFVVPTNSGAVALTGPISDIFVDYNVYYFLGAPQIYSDTPTCFPATRAPARLPAAISPSAARQRGQPAISISSPPRALARRCGGSIDSLDSWAIDKRQPDVSVDLEPPTNGFRINIAPTAIPSMPAAAPPTPSCLPEPETRPLSVTSSLCRLIWTIRNVPTG
jgi:hypothetical protein